MSEILITSNATKKALAKAGKIRFPIDTNSGGKTFPYVDNGDGIGDTFEHNGRKFHLRYHSGCFYPFLYEIVNY